MDSRERTMRTHGRGQPGGNTPVANLAQADAGSVVTFDWQDWNSVHPGCVRTFLALCRSFLNDVAWQPGKELCQLPAFSVLIDLDKTRS